MSKVSDAIDRVLPVLDKESTPSLMSIEEALDFWYMISDEADGRIDALRADLADVEDESE